MTLLHLGNFLHGAIKSLQRRRFSIAQSDLHKGDVMGAQFVMIDSGSVAADIALLFQALQAHLTRGFRQPYSIGQRRYRNAPIHLKCSDYRQVQLIQFVQTKPTLKNYRSQTAKNKDYLTTEKTTKEKKTSKGFLQWTDQEEPHDHI